MAKLHPDLIEAPIIEDEIHFFKRQAEVASRAQRSDGRTGLVVASAATCGWTVLLQATGTRAAKTASLSRQQEVRGEADAPSVFATEQNVIAISVSPDEALVALVSESAVQVHGLHAAAAGASQPIAVWSMPPEQTLLQFMWRKMAATEPPIAYILASSGSLLEGKLGSQLQNCLPELADASFTCAAISADGQLLALGAGSAVTVYAFGTGKSFSATVNSQELDAAEEGTQLQVSSVHWMSCCAILLGCSLILASSEQEAAPIVVLQWQAWSGITDQPVHLRLVDFFPADIQPDVAIAHGSPAGLLAVTVPQWGLTVLAHRKASDDHIRLIGPPAEVGLAQSLEVTGEFTAVRIPAGPDDADNFITGLALDLTSMHIPVLHPNPEKSNLPPSPLLLVATSDGCIRSYTLGSTTEPPIVQPARPIPQPAYLQSLPAVAEAEPVGQAADEEAAAAAVALPSEDEDAWEDDSSPSARRSPQLTGSTSASSTAALGRRQPAISQESSRSAGSEDSEVQSRATPFLPPTAPLPQTPQGAVRNPLFDSPLSPPDVEQAALSTPLGGADSGSFDSASSVGESPSMPDGKADGSSAAADDSAAGDSSAQEGDSAEQGDSAQEGSATSPGGFPDPQKTASLLKETAAEKSQPARGSTLFAGSLFGSAPAFSSGSFAPTAPSSSNPAATTGSADVDKAGSTWSGTPREAAARAAQARAASATPAQPSPAPFSFNQLPASLPASSSQPHSASLHPSPAAASAASSQADAKPSDAPPQKAERPPVGQHTAEHEPNSAPVSTTDTFPHKPVQAASPPARADSAASSATALPSKPASRSVPAAKPVSPDHALPAAKSAAEPQRLPRAAVVKFPEAQLAEEGQQAADMEANFLQSLHETRTLEAQLLDALPEEEALPKQLREQAASTRELAAAVMTLKEQTEADNQTFRQLLSTWQEDSTTLAALPLFKAQADARHSEAGNAGIEPGMAVLMTRVDADAALLSRHAAHLRSHLDALTSGSAAAGGRGLTADKVYGAVNAQAVVVRALLARIHALSERLGGAGGSPLPMEGISLGSLALRSASLQQLSRSGGSKRGAPPSPTPYDSAWSDADAASPWKSVRRTPVAGTPRSPTPAFHTPASSLASTPLLAAFSTPLSPSQPSQSSPWKQPGAADLRKLILAKAANREGGTRTLLVGPRGEVHRPAQSSQVSHSTLQQGTRSSAALASTADSKPWPPPAASPPAPAASPQRMSRAPSVAQPVAKRQLPQPDATAKPAQAQTQMQAAQGPAQSPATQPAARPAQQAAAARSTQPPIPSRAQVQAAQAVHVPGAAAGKPAAGSQPPIPSRAQVQAAQAVRVPGATSSAAGVKPAVAGGQPPIPSRAQVQAAQALKLPGVAAAKLTATGQPPIPSRAQVQAAQSVQLPGAKPAAAGQPPIPSKAQVQAAQAMKLPPAARTSGSQPPVPPSGLVKAAQQQQLPGAAPSVAASQSQAAAASSHSSFFSWAQPSVSAAATSAATPAAADSPSSPSIPTTSPGVLNLSPAVSLTSPPPSPSTTPAASFSSMLNLSSPSEAASNQPAASLPMPAFPSSAAQPSVSAAPASSAPASLFGSTAASSFPNISSAPTPALVFPAASSAAAASPFQAASPGSSPFAGGFSSSTAPAFGTSIEASAAPATGMDTGFARAGSVLPVSSGGFFGASEAATPATPASLSFGGFGLGSSQPQGSSPAASPFGKGLSFATPAQPPSTPTQPQSSPFSGGFASPASSSAFAGGGAFSGGFGGGGNAFGSPATPSASQQPSSGFGGFGQPAATSTNFAQPAFMQAATPGFGQPSSFGAGFGQPATPAASNAAAFSSGFGGAGGFAAFAQQSSPGFGASSGGFGGFAQQGQQQGAFGGFASQGGSSGFGAFNTPAQPPAPAAPGSGAMWELRR